MAEAFENIVAFSAALTGIGDRAEEAVRLAVVEAAHLIERGAKQNAPVGASTARRTGGTLRRSIRVYGPTPRGAGRWEAAVGPSVVYGRRIELGFTGTDKIGRHYDQAAKPYLRPAFEAAVAGPVLAVFERHVSAAMGLK